MRTMNILLQEIGLLTLGLQRTFVSQIVQQCQLRFWMIFNNLN